jgi:hypothetical protein
MEQNYNFNRNDNIDPTGTNISTDISTSIRGDEPPFEAVMSGMEGFLIACGFELNGSGIGRIPRAE